MEPTIANIRSPLIEAELATYQRFVRKLNESAQAAQEACMAYEAFVASKALKMPPAACRLPPAACRDPKMVALFKKKLGGVPGGGGRGYAGVGLAR